MALQLIDKLGLFVLEVELVFDREEVQCGLGLEPHDLDAVHLILGFERPYRLDSELTVKTLQEPPSRFPVTLFTGLSGYHIDQVPGEVALGFVTSKDRLMQKMRLIITSNAQGAQEVIVRHTNLPCNEPHRQASRKARDDVFLERLTFQPAYHLLQ